MKNSTFSFTYIRIHNIKRIKEYVELAKLSKNAYNNMIKDSKYRNNKELMIIPNAVHTDLYDNLEVIPFDKIEEFFIKNLK